MMFAVYYNMRFCRSIEEDDLLVIKCYEMLEEGDNYYYLQSQRVSILHHYEAAGVLKVLLPYLHCLQKIQIITVRDLIGRTPTYTYMSINRLGS